MGSCQPFLAMLLLSWSLAASLTQAQAAAPPQRLNLGWAQGDITPTRPAALGGMTSMRVASQVMDPLTVTALAIEAPYQDHGSEPLLLVSCDLRAIFGTTAKAVRAELKSLLPDFDPQRLILFATHCHNAPPLSTYGQKTDAMDEPEYLAFAAPRIAAVAAQAWNQRQPGGISFGLSHATVGHNRLMAYQSGKSVMGGRIDDPQFSHVEGFEDSAVQLLYTWNEQGQLTGVVINAAVTAQVSQRLSVISADFWHDTRVELRQRLGEGLFVLPQVSAAGDQMSKATVYQRAESRMEKLAGRNRRQQIAMRLADAVTAILPIMKNNVQWSPPLAHASANVPLRRRIITQQELDEATAAVEAAKAQQAQSERELIERPELKDDPKWAKATAKVRWELGRAQQVIRMHKQHQDKPITLAELHVIRLGDMAMATNPFELYLDLGLRIMGRSKPVQTFVVELACDCKGYLPSARAVAGGAYGSDPASSEVGPEGGADLVDWTVDTLNAFWPAPAATTQPTTTPQPGTNQ
jgi:hypothetical protein